MTAIAIIPARGGSKRLPRKNILPFHGRPMISWPILAAQAAGLDVLVSSDSPEILDVAFDYGARPVLRPPHLATDDCNELHTYRDALDTLPEMPEYFLALYATAAFVSKAEIEASFMQLKATGADVVMGATAFNDVHPYQAIVKEGEFWRLKCPGLNEMSPYPPAAASNGSLYWFRTKAFLKDPTYFPPRLEIFYTKAVDINYQSDFDKAEKIAIEGIK